MKIRAGYLGVLIVVVALMGSIVFAYVSDVGEHTETVEKYEYITDVSGLYNYSQERQYIDHSPAANYTGWTSGTYYFNQSSTTNNYNVVLTPGTTSTTSASASGGSAMGAGTITGALWNGTSVSLASILTGAGIDYTAVDYCRVDLWTASDWASSYGGVAYLKKALDVGDVWNTNTTYTPYYQGLLSTGATITGADVHYIGGGYLKTSWGVDWDNPGYTGSDAYIIIERDGTATIHADKSYNGAVYPEVVGSGNVGALRLVSSDTAAVLNTIPGQPITSDAARAYLAAWASTHTAPTITITTTTNTTYAPMDIRTGITLKGTSSNWMNGYDNGQVDILVRSAGAGTTTIYPTWTASQTATGAVISFDSGGNMRAGITGQTPANLGQWGAAVLSLRADGAVIVTPIKSYVNAQTYTTAGYSVEVGQLAAPAGSDIRGFDMSITGTSAYYSVIKTRVFLDTYGVVMIDPTINIRDYFPAGTYPTIRLNMYSFASTGDSITINGVTYAVTKGVITIPYHTGQYGPEGVEIIKTYAYALNSMSIDYNRDGHVYLTVNNGDRLDLGAVVNTDVSAVGIWYFTTGADKGVESTEVVYDWNIGTFGMNKTEFVVVFAGLVIVGALIARRTASPTVLDWAVVGLALFCILGMV